jgi:hypothetical protein
VWLVDLVDDVVVWWVDTCSPDYELAVQQGVFAVPEVWEGYPVRVVYTCGTEIVQAVGIGAFEILKVPKEAWPWTIGGGVAGSLLGLVFSRSILVSLLSGIGGAVTGYGIWHQQLPKAA